MEETLLESYTEYCISRTTALLAIDSPTGYTDAAADDVLRELTALGYAPQRTVKGGVLCCLGGADDRDAVLLEAHVDTLGGMVCQILPEGGLRISPLGGLNPNNAEGENVRVVTKDRGVLEGTFQLENASIHVNGKYNETARAFDKMEVVLDADARDKEAVEKLGVAPGDIVCFEPRTRITPTGFIKSRFLDDKLSVGILLGYARYLREQQITPARTVWVHVTVYEEVGHGGCAPVPDGVTEGISVDMGCVGRELTCREQQVSICAKDSHGPYAYAVVQGLIAAARRAGVDYAVDVYPHYGSDVEETLSAGADIRHGLIGAGVYASHGYERAHREGVKNTFKLLCAYLG